jgi:hypothetical protein
MPQYSIGTTGTLVAQRNAFRKSISFQHIGTANFIYLDNMNATGITTSNASIRLGSNGSATFNVQEDGEEQVQDDWSAVSDTGTNTLLVKETFTKKRIGGA